MEWGITRETCEQARINKTAPYACASDHSDCVDSDAGYRCACSRGFEGNPYLIGGCTGFSSYFLCSGALLFCNEFNGLLLGDFRYQRVLGQCYLPLRWHMREYTGGFQMFMPARKKYDGWRLCEKSKVDLDGACCRYVGGNVALANSL